jgi:hypothetical protein
MQRKNDFKAKWEFECGIRITSRCISSNSVESAICLFCRAFGKDELDVGDVPLRKRSKNFQTYTDPWRIDKMKNHNNSMHPTKWAEYQMCASADKKTYFDTLLAVNSEKHILNLINAKGKRLILKKI